MDDYSGKVKGYSLEELENILRNIDKEKFPDRYEIAKQELEKKTLLKKMEIKEGKVELASPSDRLAAALVDMFILLAPILIFLFSTFSLNDLKIMRVKYGLLYTLTMLIGGQVIYLLINGRLLYKYGQTVGKRYLEIKIVDLNNNLPELSFSYGLRYFIPALFPLIPFIGYLIGIIDLLFIFRKDRRCIHDHIAGTKVIKVNHE